ncbi:hypothetical protein [Calothrix sp. CCY 0018]|uniref:hypothetical protein n=1 Tax=Calothrix sp. CCY 0018 TaxID=3103864 RepID=UPI0039C70FB3
MNKSIELPSGKILNVARFIALLPPNDTTDGSYQLLLEGYPNPINLELSDAQTLKKTLELDKETAVWDKNKQLEKNQRAIEILGKRIQHFQNIPESESIARQEFFESFKKTIDSQRPDGQKLYS